MHKEEITMLNSIINYINYLESAHNLLISIHGDRLKDFTNKAVPYNIHRNPYCIYIKSNRETWNKCIACQYKVCEKTESGMFFGSCYAGVGEYIIPIKNDSEVLGFISVSGYKGMESKLYNTITKYGFSRGKTRDLYNTCLSEHIPDINLIKQLIEPLAAMITLFYIKTPAKICSDDGSYIYGHILTILHTGYMNRLTISDIASSCHCSVSYVSHLFKSKTGTSINKYLTQIRIAQAKKLLSDSGLSISEISDPCGFCDSDYFIYVFGKITGITPKKYRNLKK